MVLVVVAPRDLELCKQKECDSNQNGYVSNIEDAGPDTADSNVQEVYDLSVIQPIYPVRESASDK